jgi:hypothetical protein
LNRRNLVGVEIKGYSVAAAKRCKTYSHNVLSLIAPMAAALRERAKGGVNPK